MRPGTGPAAPPTHVGHLSLVARQWDYWVTVYRRTWRGSVINSFVTPVLYLVAIGGVLGRFVDAGAPQLGEANSYLEFVAPGLLAAQTLQLVVSETLWPVMGMISWNKTYHAMIATPLRVADIVAAHLMYILARVVFAAAVFTGVLAAFGVFGTGWAALLAWAVQPVIGLALAACFYTVGATARSDATFSVTYRAVFMPMFLFSGAFFPVATLGPALQVVAWLTPLWHGVELTRMVTLGAVDAAMVPLHLGVLTALAVAGSALAVRALQRRLIT